MTDNENDILIEVRELIVSQQELINDQHGIINCQGAVIESLREQLDGETVNNMKLGHEIERLRHILISFMNEIESYEQKSGVYLSNLPKIIVAGTEKENVVKQIKSEAINEFAERVKQEINFPLAVWKVFDNLVKEMEGEGK